MRCIRFSICPVLAIVLMLSINTEAFSNDQPPNSIRFSFGAWDVPGSDIGIDIHHTDLGNNERLTEGRISGLSGSFAFSHMIGQRFAWELAVGGFSDTETETLSAKVNRGYRGDYYETIVSNSRSVSVAYTTLGLIYYPLYELDQFDSNVLDDVSSFVRPYLTAGIGYYFGWDVSWNEHTATDVYFTSTIGAYPGVGLDLILSKNFIFNIDLRYHFVEFGEPLKGIEDYSGANVVAGFKVAF